MHQERLEEVSRKYIQLAVEEGKAHIHSGSGYVHYEGSYTTINQLLFAYALIQLKTAQSITEGNLLLKKILPYGLHYGLFPAFLTSLGEIPSYEVIADHLLVIRKILSTYLVEDEVEKSLLKIAGATAEFLKDVEGSSIFCWKRDLLFGTINPLSAQTKEEYLRVLPYATLLPEPLSIPVRGSLFWGALGVEFSHHGSPLPTLIEYALAKIFDSKVEIRKGEHLLLLPLLPNTLLREEKGALRSSNGLKQGAMWEYQCTDDVVLSCFDKRAITPMEFEIESDFGKVDERIDLYLTRTEESAIIPERGVASTFFPGEKLYIRLKERLFILECRVISGELQYIGEVALGKPPYDLSSEASPSAHKISLRLLRGSGKAKLSFLLSEVPIECQVC